MNINQFRFLSDSNNWIIIVKVWYKSLGNWGIVYNFAQK